MATASKKAAPKKAVRKKSTKPSSFLVEAFQAAQSRLILAEQQLEALHFILRNYDNRYQSTTDLVASTTPLRAAIYQRITNAQRDVLAFGALVGGEALQEAKYMAWLQFLNDRYEIMHMLSSNGEYPGSWAGVDEEAFRRQLQAAIFCNDPDHEHEWCSAPVLTQAVHDLEQKLLREKERYEAFVGELTKFDRTTKT